MQRDGHRASRHARIAVRDRDRVFFVHRQKQRRALIAKVIDEAVVQTAKAGARRECDELDVEGAQHLGDDIATPSRR